MTSGMTEIRERHKLMDYVQTAGCNCFEQCWRDTDRLLKEVDARDKEIERLRRDNADMPDNPGMEE